MNFHHYKTKTKVFNSRPITKSVVGLISDIWPSNQNDVIYRNGMEKKDRNRRTISHLLVEKALTTGTQLFKTKVGGPQKGPFYCWLRTEFT